MSPSKQLLLALLLGALVGNVYGVEGDVLAASDFRSGTQGWVLQGLGSKTGWSSEGLQSEGDVIAAIDSPSDTGRNWYYSAPKSFLGGDKSLAYNGWLVFDFGHFEYESMGMPAVDGYDVYLIAKNKKFSLGLRGVFKMDDTKLSNTYSIRLEEDFVPAGTSASWELVNMLKPVDGKLVAKVPTQHEFITCLQTLTGIWIRGSYFSGAEASWLKDVKIIQGSVNKGGNPLGAEATLINGSLVYDDKTAPPAASTTCCSSRTCVSNDKYEISFDRPGCMQSSDMYCCMSSDSCSKYSRVYDLSKAAEVVRGTDYNEGRAFMTPGTVDKCKGAGEGQYGAKYSACKTTATATAYMVKPASWGTATKNQNMGLSAIPITKPFVKDYYMGAIPKICAPATLTVEAHGDLADGKDSIMVYGEDDVYLGTIFAGNLTYLKEGHRPYDAYGPNTQCDGVYDPNVAGSGSWARLADPHHPSGNIPQHKGYRGGRNDVVTPGVNGNEDTRCTTWQPGGKQPHSLQHSESSPYVDSIAISQDRMMQYSADGQIKFTFRSVRDDSASNTYSGTGGGGATRFCNFDSSANTCGTGVPCEGCDLDGKVIFRSIKLKFSAGVCYSKALATDYGHHYIPQIHNPQNLNISASFSVPSGDTGQPGGDAALSITAGADIFGTDKKLVVYDKDLNKVGELFARESFHSLRSHMSDDHMVKSTSFGAVDAPTPFHAKSNCDTTSPILGTDRCTPADNQWSMKETLVNYTDTIRIPREKIAQMAVNGRVQLYITADVPANAFSLSAEGKARLSPITLAYPLMHCFMKAIKTGPNFGIFLERPMSYYFKETGFPMPAGDVTVFVAATWKHHVRYVTRHVGAAVGNHFAYDGVEDGLPVMRVDKDTVGDMGTVWVYKNSDGEECCPSSHKPQAAHGMHVVSGYSNCIGKAAMCTDPNLNTFDQCTEENPCAAGAVLAGSSTTMVKAGTTHVEASTDLYVGMKIQVYVRLKTGAGGDVANAMTIAGAGAGTKVAEGKFPLKITGGGGGGAVCTFEVVTPPGDATDNTVTKTACSALGAYTTVPTVSLYDHDDPEFIQLCADIGAACTGKVTANFDGNKYCSAANCAGYTAPTFTAVLDNTGDGVTAVGTKTIVNYVLDAGTTWEIHVDSAFGAAPDKDANFFRIFAEGISGFARNQRDGGTSTGTVAVPIDASTISCETRVLKTGTIEFYSSGNNKQNYVRLDSEASTFDTAYNGYKIRIRAKDGAWDSRSIKSYTGTVSGLVQADMVGSVAGVVTFKLKAETAQKVQSVASAAAGTPNVNAGTAEDVSLQLEESYETTTTIADFYKGVLIEVDIDGDPSTSDDIYVRKIAGFSAANTATPAYPDVSIKIPFIRKSLLSGRTGKAGDDAANLYLADSSDIGGSEGGRGLSDDNDFYNGMVLILDIDGYPETEDDIYVQTINDYVGATRKVTLAANAATATADSTWTIVQALTDFDLATTRSTFRIFSRGAILDAVITTGTDPANVENSEALGADANVGATTVTLGATASTTADDYRGFKLRITENGVTDAYTITDYAADKTATIYPPLLRKHTAAGATCIIHRTYEIYQDLGAECLRNVNMTVTYTYGTARSVSNDPGELSTIHSNWDQVLSRKTGWAARPEQRDVRSWTLKLAGEGYYNELYPGEGLASFDKNPLISAGTEAALLDTTAADVAAAAIELTLTGSRTNIQVGQHLLLTTISTAASRQYEVVKVVGLTTAKKISVLRGQMNTAAQVFAQNAVVSIKTTGFNTGQGMDEMAELGGTSRYSSAIDDAYTGLWVTIVEGTGVGQTRWISDYHGDSRTVYIGGSPWSIIPDTSSKYKIWYSAEIADYRSEGKIAVATYPRPVKKGYLVEFDWYGCATDVPASFLNNAWQDSTSAAGTLDQNYAPRQVRPGLPECKGQLGMRKPKQGPAVVYPRFKVLQTDYVSGVVLVKTSASHLTLDMHAETDPNLYVGRQIHVYSGANDRGTRTILQSWLGGTSQKRYTEVMLDSALDTNVAVNDIFTIYPAAGVSGKTTISEVGQNGDQYTVEEVDVVRYEYPELIEQHREWPHGYSYLQMKAGEDGEHVGNLFLKDYTQYSSDSYYTDSITIPQAVFESYVRGQPNGVSGEFPFTIKTPPGKSNIELLSIVIGYPVLKEADASSYDSTDIETKRVSSHGPPPFYPYSPGWSGVDESARTTRTHPRFQTHAYTSTCGNGVHDDGEYCDDGNEVDGDGCSSACSLEAGWACETVSLQSPSICRKGLVGSRYPDQEVGCKFYACEAPPVRGNSDNYGPEVTDANRVTWNTNFNLASADGGADGKNPAGQGMTIICSGTATDGVQTWYPGGLAARTAAAVNPYGPNYPICKLGGIQGTCTQCITWDTSSLTPSVDGDSSGVTGGLLGDSGVPGYDGSNKRRLLSDVDESAPAALSDVDESTSAAPVSVAQEGDEGQTVTL